MNKNLKNLHRYLLANNLTKEANELNKIVKKSFLLPFLFTTLTGCSGDYPHLIFRAIINEGSFINEQGSSPEIGIESTQPGKLYKFEASFEDIANEGRKEEIHKLLGDLIYSDYYIGSDGEPTRHLYDGQVLASNINLERCKKIRVCYYKIEFDEISGWNDLNSAIIDNKGGEDFSESKDEHIINHPNNKSGKKWILENGAYITPNSFYEYELSEKVNSRIERIFDSLSTKETEIVF